MNTPRIKICTFLICLIGLLSCEPSNENINIDGNINVTTNTAQNGMIQGKVLVPTIENNQLVYKGIKGATVEVLNTNFSITTAENGIFAIDGIPTGSYSVQAKWKDGWIFQSASQSVIVVRQSVSTVPDIELKVGKRKLIIYGKVYYPDKVTPFSNKLIKIRNVYNNEITSTTTSMNGQYGFDITYSPVYEENHTFRLSYYEDKLYGFNFMSSLSNYPSGLIEVDVYGDWGVWGPKP